MTLRAPLVVPPMVLLSEATSERPLAAPGTAPEAVSQIQLAWNTFREERFRSMLRDKLAAMILRAALARPPIVLSLADVRTIPKLLDDAKSVAEPETSTPM